MSYNRDSDEAMGKNLNVYQEGKTVMSNEMNASEAVYGFSAWLTCRDEKTVMSASDDAGCIAGLVDQFCKENKLTEPRDGWENNLVHPSGECSGPAK